jgi:hypothetical protein
MYVEILEASTLGWATMITNVFGEVKAIAVVVVGLGILIAGMHIVFRRHLQDLGESMASIGVGAGLVAAVIAGGAGVLGLAAASPLVAVLTAPMPNAVWGMALGDTLYSAVTLGLPVWGYLRWRRAPRR